MFSHNKRLQYKLNQAGQMLPTPESCKRCSAESAVALPKPT
jgi:hypothetical protein